MQSFSKSIILSLLACSTLFFYACSSKSDADDKKEKQGALFVQPEQKYSNGDKDSDYQLPEIQQNEEKEEPQSGSKSALFVEPDISDKSVVVVDLSHEPNDQQTDETIAESIDNPIEDESTNERSSENDLILFETAEKERLIKEEAEKLEQQRLAAEKERIAKEEAERIRVAQEAAEKLEQQRLAAEKERIAKEEAEKARIAQEAAEKLEQQRLAAEKERIAKEEAEKARIAQEVAEKIERERLAAEKERIAKEEAEKARIAQEVAEKIERERLAAEKERIAKEEAEKARIAGEKAEQERIAAEKAEQERLVKEAEEKERIAKEEAEKARLAKEAKEAEEKAEKERLAKIAAEKAKLAKEAEEAEKAKIAAIAERTKVEAEKVRVAKEAAEKAKLAQEAEEKANQERLAIIAEAKEKLEKEIAEERARIEKAAQERERLAKEIAEEKAKLAKEIEDRERLLKEEKEQLAKIAEKRQQVQSALEKSGTALISETPELKEGTTTKLLRYPDVYRYSVVFAYGGDLWSVETKGGVATRLTAHPGQELFPKYSPDGKWIAFTGQYDGDEQVYVIPSQGGVPRQLTFYPAQGPFPPRRGYDNIVYGWTPDGKSVLFRSLRDSNSVTELGALYTVNLDGGLPERLPMPTAGAGDFSPNGTQVVYSPLFRDFRSWKRYEGGWAQDLAIFDLKSKSLKKIAVTPRTERDPMWIGDDIYFVSDRNGTLNLFKYGTKTGTVKQITTSKTWDVRWASSDNRSKIVYELGGELKMYNTDTNDFRDIPVRVPHDGLAMRESQYDVSKNIGSFALSPGGKRVVLNARGDVFTVPAEKGSPRNLTQTSGAHDRGAVWSHDGSTIAWISDKTGEDQIYLIDQMGNSPAVQLTDAFSSRLTNLTWSPDGKAVGVTTADRRLYLVPTEDIIISIAEKTDADAKDSEEGSENKAENADKTETAKEFKKGVPYEVAYDVNGGGLYYTFSPCGQHIALTLGEMSGFSCVYIWSLKTQQMQRITDPNYDVFSPCWDPEGKYLYYLADREYAPMISSLEWNYAGTRNTGVFALALRKDVPNPFAPQSDEVEVADSKKDDKKDGDKQTASSEEKLGDSTEKADAKESDGKSDEKTAEKSKDDSAKTSKTPKETKIDFDGLAQRVVRVPVSFENYGHLRANKQFLFYLRTGARFNGRDSYESASVRVFDLKERKETVLTSEIVGTFTLSPDGSKILFSVGNSALRIGNANSAKQTLINVPTSNLAVDRIPVEEWEEVFNETCRKFRDYFYVKNLHGYNWKAICDQYRALLPHVAHRSDLNYVISEMISELNVGHAYVQGGDFVVPQRAKVGLPGARFELDAKENRYKIAKIFKGQNEEPKYRAPLTAIGVNVKAGDYVLEIDGKELLGKDNPYRLLQNKTQPITLTVNDKPSLEGSRKVVYQPITNESSLLYLDFVSDCRDRVDRATNGKVGYLHIPDMGPSGIAEFIKWYYPQIRKEGLVIDVRSNGGGNVSQWIIMRLNQKLLGTRYGSLREGPATYPYTVFHGHFVCLINETSASDGDIFPYYFRKSGLGPLIGKRSWGGVVGISSRGALIDGGEVMIPLIATNDENGEYIIEGTGVDPDIEVENEPKLVLEGRDPQLERGIEEVLKKIESDPKSLPTTRPADPVKTKDVIKKY